MKGVVKVGAVDADQHQSLGGQYGVRGFPTIKIFGLDKKSPTDYQGELFLVEDCEMYKKENTRVVGDFLNFSQI